MGVKSASIGVCGRKTINANHRHLLHPDSIVGNFDTNPLRQDIEEIGRMVRVNYALNVVMSFEKEIVACFWGHPTDVIREGIKISRSVSMTTIGSKADLVIASAGGYPKDINLYQAQKAMTHASLVVRPGGIILLAAACEEGVGSQSYEDFMADIFTHQDVLTRFKQQGFQVGPHKAVQIAQIAQKHPILLLSQLQPEMVQKLLLTPVTTVKEGIEQALRIDPTIHSVTILPYAVSTIPKID